MIRFATLITASGLLLGACIHRAMLPAEVKMLRPSVSYLAHVQPA